jgi:hypothetical protein
LLGKAALDILLLGDGKTKGQAPLFWRLSRETGLMTHLELQNAARRQPFEPFRLVLTTGATYDVRHPDLIMVGNRSAVIGITEKPGKAAYDHTIKVDLLHVVAIKELPASPPSANGPAA